MLSFVREARFVDVSLELNLIYLVSFYVCGRCTLLSQRPVGHLSVWNSWVAASPVVQLLRDRLNSFKGGGETLRILIVSWWLVFALLPLPPGFFVFLPLGLWCFAIHRRASAQILYRRVQAEYVIFQWSSLPFFVLNGVPVVFPSCYLFVRNPSSVCARAPISGTFRDFSVTGSNVDRASCSLRQCKRVICILYKVPNAETRAIETELWIHTWKAKNI